MSQSEIERFVTDLKADAALRAEAPDLDPVADARWAGEAIVLRRGSAMSIAM